MEGYRTLRQNAYITAGEREVGAGRYGELNALPWKRGGWIGRNGERTVVESVNLSRGKRRGAAAAGESAAGSIGSLNVMN